MKALLRFVSLLLALTMCIGAAAFAETLEYSTDSPQLLSVFSNDAGDWYANDLDRSLMATCTLMDLVLSQDAAFIDVLLESIAQDEIYVAKCGNLYSVFFFGSTGLITTFYSPLSNSLYAYLDPTWDPTHGAEALLNGMQANGSIDSCYQVSATTIWEICQAILDSVDE